MPRRWFAIVSTLTLATAAEAAPALEIPAGRPSTPVDRRVARNLMERLPLAFETNRGQAPAGWDFLVRCRGYHAFVKSTGVMFSFDGAGLSMSIDGADAREPSTKGLELPGKANYFIGNDPAKWLSNVPLVRGAKYADVAPGTTWSVGGDGRALEFAFDVEPGAASPRLRFEGGGVRVDDNGSLRIGMPSGEARISAPVAWQETASGRVGAGARFVVEKDGAVRIAVAPRDPERGVHVDPSVTYATYLGGGGREGFTAVDLDSSSNAYVVGSSDASGFPTTSGAYKPTYTPNPGPGGGDQDVVLAKVNSSGSALVYSTYIGGTIADFATGVAVDSSGNAFVRGFSYSTNYPITSGAYLTTLPSQGSPGYITEVASTGASLVYSTFTNRDGDEIAIGPSGSVYVEEYKSLSRYSAGGTSLVFMTAVPGNPQYQSSLSIGGIAVDANSDVYVAGHSGGSGVNATTGAFQTSFGGALDAFLAKIDANGAVKFVTLLGGSQSDYADGVGVNLAGQAYVVGRTSSSNFPLTSDAFSTSLVGGVDNVYVTRFNAAGASLRYSTLIGRGNAYAIRVHPYSSFVIAGYTGDSTFPVTNGIQGSFGGTYDGFLMKFNRDMTLAWSSFYGGSSGDTLSSIAMAPDGGVAAVGETDSSDLPTVAPYQSSRQGSGDGIVLRIPDTLPTSFAAVSIVTTSIPTWTVGYAYDPAQLSASGGVGPYTWSLVSGALPPGMNVAPNGVVSGTPTQTGTFTFKARADDPSELFAERQVTVLVNPLPSISPTMPDATISTAYDRVVPVVGGSGQMAFAVTSGSTPPGTNLSGSGHLTGTPTQTGNYSFAVQVTDGRGATGSGSVSMIVNVRPTIEGASPPAHWTEARPFAFQFQSFGGSGATTWSVPLGMAPTLTAINASTGRLSGVTRSAGVYPFTVRATDTAGATVDASFTVTLNAAPQITTDAIPTIAVGRPFALTLQLSGGTPPFDWFAGGGAMPPGLSIVGTTGAIGGVVTGQANGFVTFTCNDVSGASASRAYELLSADGVDLTKKKATEKLDVKAAAPVLRYLELTQGALLGVQVKGGAVGTATPTLRLVGPDRAEIDLGAWTRTTSKSLTVTRAPVPATGRYFLTVEPAASFNGRMTLTISVAPAATFASHATIASMTTAEYRFSAPPGATVSISAKAPKGGDALPHVESVFAPDGTDLVPGGRSKEKGASATFTSKVSLAGGDYRVVLSLRDLSAGDVAWTVKLKLPKKFTFAMPDVPAGQ